MVMDDGSGDHYLLVGADRPLDDWETLKPWTALWAMCQAIYPDEVFAPDDPLVTNMCQMIEQIEAEGLPKETGWLTYEAHWMYNASFFGHVWLYVGRPEKAVEYLYAFANHASPTRVWREEQGFRHRHFGQIFGDMPHNWASVEFVRLTRSLIVFERGTSLEFLAGVPREWYVKGETIRVYQTPTRFGKVTVDVTIDEVGLGTVFIEYDPSTLLQLEQIRLMLPDDICKSVNNDWDFSDKNKFILLPIQAKNVIHFRLLS